MKGRGGERRKDCSPAPSREEEADFLTWCYLILVKEKRKEERGEICQD